jgi:stage II sporulation protein D
MAMTDDHCTDLRASVRRRRLTWLRVVMFLVLCAVSLNGSGCRRRDVTRETPQMNADAQYWIRVRLHKRETQCWIKTATQVTVACGEDKPVTVAVPKAGLSVALSSQGIMVGGRAFDANEICIRPENPYVFTLDEDRYRGNLRVVVNAGEGSFDVINEVPLEAYLAGVVGSEMPPYWEPEALKVQAVVARNYCLHIKARFGKNRHWDVSRTQAHQMYRGMAAESAQVWEAVLATSGQIVKTKNMDGEEVIFPTYYSSICGGHTENSKNVFGDSYVSLQGVPCSHCQHVAKLGQFFWPMAVYDKTDISDRLVKQYKALKRIAPIVRIEPVAQTEYPEYSRLTRVKLIGQNGQSDTLRAEDLRLSIDPTGRVIKSALCRLEDWDDQWAFLEGRGWGHGVGLCQCGAQWLARQGQSYTEILQYYYPESKLEQLY